MATRLPGPPVGDMIKFSWFLYEIRDLLTAEQLDTIGESMGMTNDHFDELFSRARYIWEGYQEALGPDDLARKATRLTFQIVATDVWDDVRVTVVEQEFLATYKDNLDISSIAMVGVETIVPGWHPDWRKPEGEEG
jgi:hypothetical protein